MEYRYDVIKDKSARGVGRELSLRARGFAERVDSAGVLYHFTTFIRAFLVFKTENLHNFAFRSLAQDLHLVTFVVV